MKRKRKPDTVKSKSILTYFSSNVITHTDVCADTLSINSNDTVLTNDENINKFSIEHFSEDSQSNSIRNSDFVSNHYSIKNFSKIISEILLNEYDSNLFSKPELSIIDKYQILPPTDKKLFLQVYNRLFKWHRYDKVEDMAFKNLLSIGFVSNDFSDMDLISKLGLLQIGELEMISKKFNIKTKSKRKQELIESILTASSEKNQITKFFIVKSVNSFSQKLELELKHYLRSTFKINNSVRIAFCKLTVLFSLTDNKWDDFRHIGEKNQNVLYFLLQIDRGEVSLPLYKLSRISNIFADMKTLDNYVIAVEYLMEIHHLFDTKKYDDANTVFDRFKSTFTTDSLVPITDINLSPLPCFLRQFSLTSIIVRIYSIAVDIMEKRRQYSDAVPLLKLLLHATESQTGLSKRRGKWYFRLSLNLKHHLSDPEQSRQWLETAIKDSSTPPYFRLTFQNRLEKIDNFKQEIIVIDLDNDLDGDVITDIASRDDNVIHRTATIDAPTQYRLDGDTQRPQYLWQRGDESIYCHVEDFVVFHLIDSGRFTNGIHGETNTFIIFYVLLFYDIIYADVADAFYNYRQLVPLDLYSGAFRQNRSIIIDKKFDWLTNIATENDVNDLLLSNWRDHGNELGLVSDWRIISNEQQLLDLFWSLGLRIVLKVCDNFIDNFGYWSSGMPDLVMWNSVTREHEIIEVKGPGDKLSDKQRLWIVQLQKIEANVSLCHVNGVSCKKI